MSKRTRQQRKAEANHRQVDTKRIAANSRSIRVARMQLDGALSPGQLGKGHGGTRDYYDVLGYPRIINFDDYFGRYEREHIAARIVDFPADETWRDTPELLDGSDKEAIEDTEFTKAINMLAKRLRLFHYCQRADKMSGIGRYGVLLIGVAGDAALSEPVESLSSIDDVIYLRPYSEKSATIAELVTDAHDERYGLPLMYNLSISADADGGEYVSARVHWTRVVHIAEGLLENEIYGRPRLQRVYNLLDDIMKLVGGAAEATWKLMRKGFVLDVDPEANLTAEDEANLETQVDEYDHGLRRFLQTRGMTVHDLGSQVVDPTGAFTLIIDLIAGATGIPQRILLGSERGELASSQDASSWAGRIADRRFNWAEPVILRPVVDRLIAWGALPPPTRKEYTVKWKPLFELSEKEKAELAKLWAEGTEIMSKNSGIQAMTLAEWRGEFTPFSADLATLDPVHTQPAQPGQVDADTTLEDDRDVLDEGEEGNDSEDGEEQADRAPVGNSRHLSEVELSALLAAASRMIHYG